jgi:hypothetical protein
MSTDNNTRTDSPFNIWWVVSGIGIVLVVVALILVLIFGRGGASDDDAAPVDTTMSEPAPTETASAAPAASSCGLDDGNQDIPVSAPEATWTTVDYLLVPSSNEYGPAPLEGSEWSCFAHSPTGALFAATHVLAGAAGPDYETFMNAAAVDNTALQAWIAAEDPDTHTQSPGAVAQFVGFQMTSVAPDRVTVKLALAQSEITGSYTVDMVWDEADGTWKVDMSASTFFDNVATLENLNTFTPWAATSGS